MNAQQFNHLYEERLNNLSPYLRTIPNEDARQEACIGIYEALRTDNNAADSYLLTRAKWNQSVARRKGRSVDNGFYKRNEIKILHYDYMPVYDQVTSQIVPEKKCTPLDDLVIDKICLENLIDDLSVPEAEVFQCKVLDEMTEKDAMQKLRVGHDRYRQIKSAIREKIGEAFSEDC